MKTPEDIIERKCEHWQTNPPRQFLSSPFVFPTEEEKKILAQGLVEHRGDLLRCLPLNGMRNKLGYFFLKIRGSSFNRPKWRYSRNGHHSSSIIGTGRSMMDWTSCIQTSKNTLQLNDLVKLVLVKIPGRPFTFSKSLHRKNNHLIPLIRYVRQECSSISMIIIPSA